MRGETEAALRDDGGLTYPSRPETRKTGMMMIVGDRARCAPFLETGVLSAPPRHAAGYPGNPYLNDPARRATRPSSSSARSGRRIWTFPPRTCGLKPAGGGRSRSTGARLPGSTTEARRITRESNGKTRPERLGELVDAVVTMARFDEDTLFDQARRKRSASTSPGSMRSPTRRAIFMIRPNPVPRDGRRTACARSSP